MLSLLNSRFTGVVDKFLLHAVVRMPSWVKNRSISQIPRRIGQISRNVSFGNRNLHTYAHFCYKMMHCGMWDWCVVEFVRQSYWHVCVWVLVENLLKQFIIGYGVLLQYLLKTPSNKAGNVIYHFALKFDRILGSIPDEFRSDLKSDKQNPHGFFTLRGHRRRPLTLFWNAPLIVPNASFM